MSSNDLDQQNRKSVCFICGSYTSLTINIFEKRAGPNIVEIISEKFKVKVRLCFLFANIYKIGLRIL